MKPASPAITQAIREAHKVNAVPRLIADFNMNRYIGVTADNDPPEQDEGYDIEMFPIESIVEPIRPTKGVQKARVGESVISEDYVNSWRPRHFVASVDDIYKYWTSPRRSDANGNIQDVHPHIIYDEDVEVNKIVIKLENIWSTPEEYNVQITTDSGSGWTTIATTPNIRQDGQIILYWNGVGWSSTKPDDLTATTTLNGIRLNVTRLTGGIGLYGNPTIYKRKNSSGGYTRYETDGSNSHFNLIEISARLEVDFSDRLVNVSDTFDMAEASTTHPIGTLTSNVAEVTLWNGDNLFDADNPANPYRKFMDGNVLFNMEYVYKFLGAEYSVQQFQMYSGPWAGQRDENISLQLSDYSKFFQEQKPLPHMWENLSVPQIVWRICDSVGFVKYDNEVEDRTIEHTIPVFWTDGEKTVWEIFDELASATQTAIYFDAFGALQVKTRESALDDTKAPVWTLRGERFGNELPDIVDVEQSEDFTPNHFTVRYQTTKWSAYKRGIPAMQVVWEPEEETQTLRSSPLRATLEKDHAFLRIPAGDVRYWPFEGIVNVQGELIRYRGKRYTYYTGPNGNQRNMRVVYSTAEQNKYWHMTPDGHKHKNHLNGDLRIVERGLWNSENKAHPVEAKGYNVRARFNESRRVADFKYGFHHHRKESKIVLNPGPRFNNYKDILYATRGAADDTGFFYYGFQFNFIKEKGKSDQIAGILFHNNALREDGYYVEFKPSSKISSKLRKGRHEVLLYSRKNGKHKRIGPAKGRAIAIAEGVDYDVDIHVTNAHQISVFVNGRQVIAGFAPKGWRNEKNGKFGFFAKGKTKVSFEYLYAIQRDEAPPKDDQAWFDRVRGEYRSSQAHREYVYKWNTRRRRVKKRWRKESYRWNRQFMDEFGPYVHEVRELDVKFDPAPVLHSRLYSTNDWSVVVPEYRANAFGAKILIANSSRDNAVYHGQETLTYAGSSKEINHVFTVLGRPLIVSEGEEVVAGNESQIKRRGRIESEIDSQWIQSKTAAKDIAEWIKKHWGEGTEQLTVNIFGNPLLEIGDVVEVEFPRKNMSAETHKYWVIATNSSFEQGLTTSLTLRRVV